MQLQIQVLKESSRQNQNVEYVTITGMESGPEPLLQMVDYNLREDEKPYKGKLVGKVVAVQVENIRALFGGRPQLVGKIVNVSANGK